jgi:pilus assembly protein CpaE
MRARARDAVTLPFDADEFLTALAHIAEEERLRTGTPTSRIISFINSKGGSGATFLASNVAIALATIQQGRVLVVDMDFQFGSLPTYVDLPATNGLIKALEFADTLDQEAMQGYAQAHKSGLQVLAAAMTDIVLPEDVSEHRTKQLLSVLDGAYRYIVVDLPRRIDTATATTLMQSDEIMIVTQQTLAHLQETKRLMGLLQNQLGITPDRLRLIVNRYDKKAEIRLEDFSSVLLGVTVETVPGDFRRVVESITLGTPVVQGAPRSPVGRRLTELATAITAVGAQPRQRTAGLFSWLTRSAQT